MAIMKGNDIESRVLLRSGKALTRVPIPSCMLLQNLRRVWIVRTEGSRLAFNSWQSSCFIVEITGMEEKRLVLVVHSYNPSTQEDRQISAQAQQVPGQPGLHAPNEPSRADEQI